MPESCSVTAWFSPAPSSMSVGKATMPQAYLADTAQSMAPGRAMIRSAQVRPSGLMAVGLLHAREKAVCQRLGRLAGVEGLDPE